MAYILDGVTLPTPKAFNRELIETSAVVTTINGVTKKDITNRKERYVLKFELLTQAQASAIFTIYEDQTTKSFQVTETNLAIPATTVHMDIASRNYNTGGEEYREDFDLILTEVS